MDTDQSILFALPVILVIVILASLPAARFSLIKKPKKGAGMEQIREGKPFTNLPMLFSVGVVGTFVMIILLACGGAYDLASFLLTGRWPSKALK